MVPDICGMKQILLFGAGKSATVLIDYLLSHAEEENWRLTVADMNLELAKSKLGGSPFGRAISFDIMNEGERRQHIGRADLVISMLPATLHYKVAVDCVEYSKHLLTASYVDDALRGLEAEIQRRGLLFLCEMGLDPGIDHMSAMQIIHGIQQQGGTITTFRSHCGGLVAPESDDNPWHYKISWNARNIVLAGKAGAHYRENGQEVRLSYEELFSANNLVEIPGLGKLSWYANRDSLRYGPLYGLDNLPNFMRTTLRHPDFMTGWKKIVALGLTDETPKYDTDDRSLGELLQQLLKDQGSDGLLKGDDKELFSRQLVHLGLHDKQSKLNKGLCSAADILQFAVEKNLALKAADRDMVVMLHEFEYLLDGKTYWLRSSLVQKGDDSLRTAMAKTVGLPLAIAARLILKGEITRKGLCIPTTPEIYEPVLNELRENGVHFDEVLITQ